MSVMTVIYDKLVGTPEVADQTARSMLDQTLPAIYEGWAMVNSPFPYINLTFSFSEGNHFAKRTGELNIDIFVEGESTKAESIRDEVIKALDRERLFSEKDGQVRLYYGADTLLTEDREDIQHWNITFLLIHWRLHEIQKFNQ